MSKGMQRLLLLMESKGVSEIHDLDEEGLIGIKLRSERKMRKYGNVWQAIRELEAMPDVEEEREFAA